jgi:membrane associated rhomboid family serine protease
VTAVASRFSLSFPGRRDADDPWFRVGTVDVTTAVLVAGLCALSMFVWAISPSLLEPLVLWPDDVRGGQIWRIFTWPLANEPNIWTVLTIAMLWYFGRELERLVGRARFAWLLVLLAIVPGIVGTLLNVPQAGIRSVEIAVFALFAAEYPDLRFWGGIPAWVFAAVIIGIEILQLTGLRQSERIVLLLVSLATAALVGRSFGLLDRYPWIPLIPVRAAGSKQKRGRSGGKRKSKSSGRNSGPAVVQGPWSQSPTAAADQAELDGLLDKISAAGMDSLTKNEKQRLNELSKRLRGG